MTVEPAGIAGASVSDTEERIFSISSSLAVRLNPLLRRCGVELVRSGGQRPWSHRLNRPELPSPFDTVARGEPWASVEASRSFDVPIDRCTTPYLFSYARDGWHPLVKALDFVPDGPQGVASFLTEFYARFQPRTVLDLFPQVDGDALRQLGEWPATPEIVRRLWNTNPWLLRRSLSKAAMANDNANGSLYVGPKSRKVVQRVTARLLELYQSIAARGYQAAHRGHRIAGFFLVDGDDYRFVLCSGNHRVAVLRSLGYAGCTATFYPGWPYAVNREQLSRWTVTQGGVYEPHVAAWLFSRFLGETGAAVGARLGLG